MADVDSIVRAASDLDDAVLNLHQTLEMVMGALPIPENVPPWLFVMFKLSKDVLEKSDAFSTCVYEKALPIVRDFANAKGGMGVITPMQNSKVVAGNSANSRS